MRSSIASKPLLPPHPACPEQRLRRYCGSRPGPAAGDILEPGLPSTREPAVSVVIPAFNRARLLPRAVESVLGQTLTDLELVVVDDGSTDDTPRGLAGIADKRVRCFRFERNRGIGAARREGVRQSRGRLVAFLDSDDRWAPGKLEQVVSLFDRHPEVDLVFSDYENINHIRNTKTRGFDQAAEVLRSLRVSPLEDAWWIIEEGVPEALARSNFLGTSSVVTVRRSLFDRAGDFRTDLSGTEDLEFWWRAAVKGARFAYTTHVLVERNKDEDSITAREVTFIPQRLKALDACEETARAAGRSDLLPHLRRARARTWCDLIEAWAVEGRRGAALRTFGLSWRDGLSFDAVRHAAAALAGPRVVSIAKRIIAR
jgi:glycosyltransferase involved in cell wall biosynthesis